MGGSRIFFVDLNLKLNRLEAGGKAFFGRRINCGRRPLLGDRMGGILVVPTCIKIDLGLPWGMPGLGRKGSSG